MRPLLPLSLAAFATACGYSTIGVEGSNTAEAAFSFSNPAPDAGTTGSADGGDEPIVDIGTPPEPECLPGQTSTCETSCGSTGTRACDSYIWAATCSAPTERCGNGSDDDCDGLVDAADSDCRVCTPGATRTCTTSCGSSGHEGCTTAGQWETTCRIPSEVCGNGLDDDCDGRADTADDDCWVCTPGTTRSCTTSCGSTGREGCSAAGQWEGTCRRPSESCDNGVDDDCDGRVDHHDTDCTPIIHRCEDTEGGGCNGDMGYGDHCSAADNTGGCSAGRFWAWCNRRNPAYPNIWDNWIINWVDSRCDGTLAETGTQYSTWYCTSSSNDRYECTTPLVLAFDGAPVHLAPADATFAFTPGRPVRSAWPRPVTPWLVRDLDGDGRIDSGRELFGSDTRLPDGTLAAHGFAALAALDQNHDGAVDARDPAFASLRLWSDLDADRFTGPGELRTLAQAGVVSLSLRFSVEPRCDSSGNCERERAAFTWVDRAGRTRTGAVVDLYLATAPAPLVCAR